VAVSRRWCAGATSNARWGAWAPRLGVVVLFIAVPQVVVVPMIQRRINVHVKERSHTLVRAGDLMVESAPGQRSITGSRGGEISKAFETIYLARRAVFKLKFGLKFLISALQSAAIFVLLFAGGIMVLNGKTEIGIVVAFISGLDRVLEPWREMIAFLRSTSAARVQFDQIESTLEKKL
jgi:ABC-type multidrug transport system fused ATPase/permease subunit